MTTNHMAVAVTGASGHIGANLVRALVDAGRHVRCIVHHNREALKGLAVEEVTGDIMDTGSLCRAFEGADVVYHLASRISLSMKDWPRVEAINVGGTRNVIEACRTSGVRRLVHFSSIHAIDQQPYTSPVDESRPLVGPSAPPYDRSKAAGERLVLEAVEQGLDAIIIAPTGVIGPYDYEPSFFGDALLHIAQGKLPALVEAGFDWVDARDVVTGTLAAEKKATAGEKYLFSGNWVSVPEIAVMIEEIIGAACTRRTVPLWLARFGAPFVETYCSVRKTRPLYTRMSLQSLKSNRHISHGKASRELGYTPRPFRESLADTLRWFKEHGMLQCELADGINT